MIELKGKIQDALIVDSELDEESENPVQNKVVTKALNDLEDDVDTKLEGKIDKYGEAEVSSLQSFGTVSVFNMGTHDIRINPVDGTIKGATGIYIGTGEPYAPVITNGKISGLQLPQNSDDATNKQYVDLSIMSAMSNAVSKSGDTMTGELNMGWHNISGITGLSGGLGWSINGDYTDIKGINTLKFKTGGTNPVIDIEANEKTQYPNERIEIHSLATPTANTDAATKAYVDSAISAISHETWTFTLEDDTVVTKEVALWTSQQ